MRRKETETTPLFRRLPTSAWLRGRPAGSGRAPRLGKGGLRAGRGEGRPGLGCAAGGGCGGDARGGAGLGRAGEVGGSLECERVLGAEDSEQMAGDVACATDGGGRGRGEASDLLEAMGRFACLEAREKAPRDCVYKGQTAV